MRRNLDVICELREGTLWLWLPAWQNVGAVSKEQFDRLHRLLQDLVSGMDERVAVVDQCKGMADVGRQQLMGIVDRLVSQPISPLCCPMRSFVHSG